MMINKSKKPIKTVEKDQIHQIQEVHATQIKEIQETYEESNLQLRKSNKSLINQVNGLRSTLTKHRNGDSTEDEDDNELDKYDIDWTKAVQFGEKAGLDMKNFDPNNTLLVNYAKEKILENRDLAILSGILKLKGSGNGTNDSGQVSTVQTSNTQNIIDTAVQQSPQNAV